MNWMRHDEILYSVLSLSQDRDTQIFEAGENLGGSRAQTKTESGAALDVPPFRSNFAQKNATCRDSMLKGEGHLKSMENITET